MKGISAVIATILMLMITIALAGTAYLYITGVFTARTGVVLSVDPTTACINSTHIMVAVRNDGTTPTGVISIDITNSSGIVTTNVCSITTITAGGSASAICPKTGASGLYSIRAYSGSSSAPGSAYCAS